MAAVLLLGAAPAQAGVVATPVSSSPLNVPTAFTFPPDGDDVVWYVERLTGRIRRLDLGTGQNRLFATVSNVNTDGERGMLGIALHPRYPDRPFVYVFANRTVDGRRRNQILRYRDDAGTGRNRTVIWSSPDGDGSSNHNGGHIAFGPDRMLYAVVGDDGDPANSQDRTHNDRGKILRMTPRGRAPADNPFGNRIFAYGIRNSFGFAFDPRTGRLWESENGPTCNDELNRIRGGRNYGWGPSQDCSSGSAPRNTNRDGPRPVMPEAWWTPTIAPTGVAFCRGCGLGPKSRGRLFMADWNTGRIRRINLVDDRRSVGRQRVVFDHDSGIFSLEAGPGGLYFSDASGIYLLERG